MSYRPTVPFRDVRAEVDAVLAIESRQDDLLRRLDELNARIERVLAELGAPPPAASRQDSSAA